MKLVRKILCFTLALLMVVSILPTSLVAEAKSSKKAAASSGVAIGGVLIQGDQVVIATSGTTGSEDGLYHLVASDCNQANNVGTDVAQAAVAAAVNFTVPLNKGTADSMLLKKFTICVMKGGALTAVSNSMYITNPEACAGAAPARMDFGKKGLLASTEAAVVDQCNVKALGVNQVTLTLPLSKISNGTGVPFTFNGRQYNFETRYISGFDHFIRRMNAQGAQVSVILVVDAAAKTEFINPYSYDGLGAHNYYGLNAATTDGLNIIAAAGAYLAKRWSGAGLQVDNYIIGNEVNAYTDWNYMNCGSAEAFTKQYSDAFRMLYNGIKSENATANVYCCTDQQWARSASIYYPGKTFLTLFNNNIRSTGNIDWRLATHAYNVPLYNADVWSANKNLTHNQNSPYISLRNIDVVTDFLCQKDFLSPTGAVRTVKLSEQGYTSLTGEQAQAVAVTYAYLVALNNSHIDGMILSREKDEAVEIAQGLANGLMGTNNAHKLSYEYYQHAGDPAYTAQASAMCGIDLNTLITPR